MTYMEQLAAGKAVNIDDFVDEWHDADGPPNGHLHEFLGMTRVEYGAWAEGRLKPEQILEIRKEAANISDRTRMEWLTHKHVQVRIPLVYGSLVYGSLALFHAQSIEDEGEAYRTSLREQIDFEITKEKYAKHQNT
jgi:hypothetical protein